MSMNHYENKIQKVLFHIMSVSMHHEGARMLDPKQNTIPQKGAEAVNQRS